MRESSSATSRVCACVYVCVCVCVYVCLDKGVWCLYVQIRMLVEFEMRL